MGREKLGGFHNSLIVEKENNRYVFSNDRYGMIMYVRMDDINKVINNPRKSRWSDTTYSNSVESEDKDLIIKYLKIKARKYKTVDELMKSRSKYKEKYLMQFSMEELQEYIKKKEDTHVKVKSGD